MREQTPFPSLNIPVDFHRLEIREDVNTRKASDLVQVPYKKCPYGCRRKIPRLLLPLKLLFLDTLRLRVIDCSKVAAAYGVGVSCMIVTLILGIALILLQFVPCACADINALTKTRHLIFTGFAFQTHVGSLNAQPTRQWASGFRTSVPRSL